MGCRPLQKYLRLIISLRRWSPSDTAACNQKPLKRARCTHRVQKRSFLVFVPGRQKICVPRFPVEQTFRVSATFTYTGQVKRQGPHPSRLRRATFPKGEGLWIVRGPAEAAGLLPGSFSRNSAIPAQLHNPAQQKPLQSISFFRPCG